MIYQNILAQDEPFIARKNKFANEFPEHRHADIEIHYCIKGEVDIFLDKKPYKVSEGQLVFISPMVSHEVPKQKSDTPREIFSFIVGISFLKEHFNLFSKGRLPSPILTLDSSTKTKRELEALLTETAEYSAKDRRARLLVQGNLYKICYYLSESFSETLIDDAEKSAQLDSVENIDKALDLIYYDYRRALTVEDAAEITGYSKSNFCRIFKKITGKTFHTVLNSQRIEVSARLLSETNLSVSEIAELVGLCDAKKLCRVFKEIKGETPGGYRKRAKNGI